MGKTALIILSEGFEDIEAVAPIDVLTRSGVEVTIASLEDGPVTASYGLTLIPHTTLHRVTDIYDALILPGGAKQAINLAGSRLVSDQIIKHHEAGNLVAGICASPGCVLAGTGILNGRQATGDPMHREKLTAAGAEVTDEPVTVDGNIITAMGPGAALEFGLTIAEYLTGSEAPDRLRQRWRMPKPVASRA